MYPFPSLPDNVAAFCASLRHNHHFKIGPREMIDAIRALEIVDVSNEQVVRDALRPVLSKTSDDARVFDEAFDQFFRRTAVALPSPEVARGFDSPSGTARSRVFHQCSSTSSGQASPTRSRLAPVMFAAA